MAGDRKEYHVVQNPNGGWDVKRENSEKASFHFSTKAEAEAKASELGKKIEAEMIVHKKDGTFQKANSYGNDPFPPRDLH